MKHLKTFEAFVDKEGNLQAFSKGISVNGDVFDFDLYNVNEDSGIVYIEGKVYFKPKVEEFEGTIIFDRNLDKCFSEFDEDFYEMIAGHIEEFESFCEKVKGELIR